jgi:sugar phosphate isomerase/epimerase
MQDSIYRYMELGFVLPTAYPDAQAYPEALLEAVRAVAADPFWTAVELPPIADEDRRRVVGSLLASAGVAVVQASQSTVRGEGLDLGDAARRDCAVERLTQDLDLAVAVGASVVAVLSGPEAPDARRPAAMEATAETLCRLADAAKARGLGLVLETFDTNMDKKRLIGPTARAVELARAVGRDNFGLLLDLAHLPLRGESPAESVAAAGAFLRHVYLGSCVLDKESPAYGDSHPGFTSPGSVNGPDRVREMFHACFDSGFLGDGNRPFVSVKVKPQAGETSEVVLAAAKRTLNEAWALL